LDFSVLQWLQKKIREEIGLSDTEFKRVKSKGPLREQLAGSG
jgi:hypothetical protein